MVVVAISAIGSFLAGTVGWFTTLPNTFKYIIFLGGLLADAGIVEGMFGLKQGVIGGIVTVIAQGFVPSIVITSWQLLIVFAFLPFVSFLLKNSLSHQ